MYSFSKSARILKKSEFDSINKSGRRFYSKDFIVVIKATERSKSRLGLVISKKLSNKAVVRNHLKRLIRESFRQVAQSLSKNFDIIVIGVKNAANLNYVDVNKQLHNILQQAKAISSANEEDRN